MAITRTPFTSYAVQRALGVPEDGKWGKVTEAAAKAFLGPEAASWDRSRLIIGVQQKMMVQAGIQVTVDGFNGPDTKEAMEQFQGMMRSPQLPRPAVSWWDRLMHTSPSAEPTPAAEPEVADAKGAQPGVQFHKWPKQSGVPDFYGEVGTSQTIIKPVWPMVLAWDKSTSVRGISLHSKVADSATEVMEAALAHYGTSGIEKIGLNLWGGSLNVRKMRGGNSYSMHSWGIAMDFDPDRNELRMDHTKARLAKPDAKAWFELWEAAGWTSLGRARDMDWMHVQAASL